MRVRPELGETTMDEEVIKVVPPRGGKDYDLFLDHQFVKVSGIDTGGLYTIIEDELESGCELGLHLHREHMESFSYYIPVGTGP